MRRHRANCPETTAALALMTAPLLLAPCLHAGGWQRMADLPEPNGGMVCQVLGEDVIVSGGTNWEKNSKQWLAKRWRFDAGANAWGPLLPLPAPLAYAAAAGDAGADAVLTAGGSDASASSDAILEWRGGNLPRRLARLPRPVTLAAAASSGGRLFVIGGAADIADFSTVTAQCFEWRMGQGDPRRLPDYPAGPTAMAAVAAASLRLFAFTGATWDAAGKQVVNRSAAFAFDPKASKWDAIRPHPFTARGVAAVALGEKQILLAGGYRSPEEGFTDEAFLYDTETDRYVPCLRLPICAIVNLVKTREWLWVLGGEDRQRHRSATCWRIRLDELMRAR